MEISGDQVRGELAYLFSNLRDEILNIKSDDQVAETKSLMAEIEVLEFSIRLLNKWGEASDMFNILSYIKATCLDTETDHTVLESRLKGPRSTLYIRLLEPIMYVGP